MRRFLKTNYIIILILLLGVVLRFVNLFYIPGWLPDEGFNLNLAYNLLHGKLQSFSITYYFVPHPPLFFVLSLPFLKIFGHSLLALRVLSACAGLVSILFLYLTGNAIGSKRSGQLAALLYAVYPSVVFSNRTGFTYSLFTTFVIITFYFTIKFLTQKNDRDLVLAAFFSSVAFIVSYFGIAIMLFVLVLAIFKRPAKLADCVASMIILPFCYLLAIFLASPASVVHDFKYLLSRNDVKGFSPGIIWLSYWNLIRENPYIIFGLVGLFFLPKKSGVWTFLFLLLLSLAEFKFRSGYWDYISTYLFIPIFALAIAVDWLFQKIEKIRNKHPRYVFLIIAFTAFSFPVDVYAMYNTKKVIDKEFYNFGKGEESFSPGSMDDVKKTADFIRENSTPRQIIMISPHLAWTIPNLTTDPILAHVYRDQPTVFYPGDLYKTGRFLYDCSLQNVKYFVEDKEVRNWFVGQPGISSSLSSKVYGANNPDWSIVKRFGDLVIYKNNRYPASPSSENS